MAGTAGIGLIGHAATNCQHGNRCQWQGLKTRWQGSRKDCWKNRALLILIIEVAIFSRRRDDDPPHWVAYRRSFASHAWVSDSAVWGMTRNSMGLPLKLVDLHAPQAHQLKIPSFF
jgi:hypothetical protein